MITKIDYNKMELTDSIAKQFNLDINIAKLLSQKDFNTLEEIESFLYPSIENLSSLDNYVGLKDVSQRIKDAIINKEIVIIYGDYDCDGICGVSILYSFLLSQGVTTYYYIPNRHTDGYGLNVEALEALAERFLPDLIISVDCGITSVEEVQYAQEVLGVDMIITDHHEPQDILPQCLIFNPKLSQNNAFEHLCGAGVALRLVESIAGVAESKKYYDIASLATIADVVPLVGDNRIITYFGLKSINSGYRKGLKMLVDSCVKEQVKSSDIAFKIAPRINAMGRVDDANKVVDLFINNDHFMLNCLVDEINKSNETRQLITKDLESDCYDKLIGYDFKNKPIIVLYNAYWDEGVLGICASRLVGKFNRPVILFTKAKDGSVKGSGRSIEGINLFECIGSCEDILKKFGGHKMACGLSLELDNLDNFIVRINNYCQSQYDNSIFEKKYYYDLDIQDISNKIDFAKQLEVLQPFGEANNEPKFLTNINSGNFGLIGASHIKSSQKDYDIIGFGWGKYISLFNNNDNKVVIGNMSCNVFRNTYTAQIFMDNVFAKEIKTNDYFEYVSQCMYDNKCITPPTMISQSQVDDIVNSNDFGVCYVTYDCATANKFLDKHKNIKISNQILQDYIPQNTLIHNPSIEENLVYFSKIVFLDMPMSLGVVDELQLSAKVQVYCVQNYDCLSNCAEYLADYAELGKIFIGTKALFAQKQYKSYYNLYLDLQKDMNLNYNVFVIAWWIFVELGIIKSNQDSIFIDNTVQNKINNSKLYKTLIEAKNG